jgi:plastocyanin
VKTIATKNIQGPWDSTAKTEGSKTTLFVSNALNGGAAKAVKPIDNSTVLRIELQSGEGQAPKVTGEQVIASGIAWVDSPEALVLGPTGLALASNGTLYVASTQDNRILAIPEAATRTTAVVHGGTVLTEGGHLKEPLGMVLAPNGDIITTNGGDGNMVETTPEGRQVAVQTADTKTGAGSLFGLAIAPSGHGIYYVDDGENTVNLLASAPAPAPAPAPAGSSAASSAHEGAGSSQVSVQANPQGQLKYNTNALTASAGKVAIAFTNMSPVEHNVTVESASGQKVGATPTFTGATKTLALTLKAGVYKFFCSVPGHRMAGMEGTLTVK